mgnify:CR=1 FL=1
MPPKSKVTDKTNVKENKKEDKSVMPDDDMHDDKMVKLYYGALGLLGLYKNFLVLFL